MNFKNQLCVFQDIQKCILDLPDDICRIIEFHLLEKHVAKREPLLSTISDSVREYYTPKDSTGALYTMLVVVYDGASLQRCLACGHVFILIRQKYRPRKILFTTWTKFDCNCEHIPGLNFFQPMRIKVP